MRAMVFSTRTLCPSAQMGDTVLCQLRWDKRGRIYIPNRALQAALWDALSESYPILSLPGGRRCGGMTLTGLTGFADSH